MIADMAGNVFVTGGSGFVGSAVIDELLRRQYHVTALSHQRTIGAASGVRVVEGGLFSREALDEGMRGADAVIHLVGIIVERKSKGVTFERMHFEGTRSIVDAAKRNNIKRYVHMSALGTRPDGVSTYHKTKFAAEQYVRASGLDWTIFRPSLIHGPGGEFMKMESAWARRKAPPFLFMPYFGAGPCGGRGAGKLQPVHVADVARAFVDALEKLNTIGEVYPLAGPDVLTWPQLHHTVAQAIIGKRRAVMAVPSWYGKLLTHVVPPALLPFNHDQVVMSQEDNTTDLSKFKDDFGWDPQPFKTSLEAYAKSL